MSHTYSEAVVLRVNELFHDLTGRHYQREVESEMLVTEGGRWRTLWERFVEPHRGWSGGHAILDIGTGTGFVPLAVAPFLRVEDRLVCSDVSGEILEIARENITARDLPAAIDFVKLAAVAPFRLPFEEEEFTVVTMNSVLHHLKETDAFLAEVDRILAPGGVLVIGHEPNRTFRSNVVLRALFQIARALFVPRAAAIATLRASGLYGPALRFYYRLRADKRQRADDVAATINAALLREGLIERELRPEEIPAITDIRDDEGFDPAALRPDYEMLHLESYNHLLTVDVNRPSNRLVGALSAFLRRRYPGQGATFLALYRKPGRHGDPLDD